LETLNVSETEAFCATLAAPNDFDIMGGAMKGGGGVCVDEPPPQPQAQQSPSARTMLQERTRVSSGTLPMAPCEQPLNFCPPQPASLIQKQIGWIQSTESMLRGNPT
jgi:hypothetical protein